jgi:DNA-binding XRE family transcriptional regulator
VLDAAADWDLTGFREQFRLSKHSHVVRDVRQRMIKGFAHQFWRGGITPASGPTEDVAAELVTEGLFDVPICRVLPHALEPLPRTIQVRNWLSIRISEYWLGSIEWLSRIITRLFAAAIKLGKRNDPLVSDATRVSAAFGQRLAQLRTDKGLSQEQVADLAGVHRTAISNLEKGAHLPRLDTLLKLAAALAVEPCWLIRDLPAWTPASTSPGRFAD